MLKKSVSAVAKEPAGPLLTRDDIAALLVAYYGAVRFDQIRADQLRKEGCLPCDYDRKHWKAYRKDHLFQLEKLLDTLSYISQETLTKLTVLATTRKPKVVRAVLVELLLDGALAYMADEREYNAAEFFNALVKQASQGARAPKDGDGTAARIMRWLEPTDPLRISKIAWLV